MSDLVKRLEPCPFCGGEAAVLGGKFPHIGIRYGVNCRGECGTFLDAREVHQSDAIRAWNGNRPRLRSEIERRDLQLEVASKAALKLADELARLRSEVERLTRERDEAWMNGAKAASMYHVREAEWHMRNSPSSGTGRVAQHQYYAERVVETANTLFNELKEKDNG